MENNKYTIAHLSDLHLSPEYYPERSILFRSMLQQCADRRVDHIVITGDITNQAKRIEYDEFRQITAEANVLDGKRMTVIVGNHDVFGGPYRAEDLLEFPSLCKTTDYKKKLDEFVHHTKETFTGTVFAERESLFPFVKSIGPVSLVGLNSIAPWSPLKNPIGSNGEIDDHQFDLLESLIADLERKRRRILILVHHHFSKDHNDGATSKWERLWSAIEASTMKLRKKKRLLKIFLRAGVEGVMHGHIHKTEEYVRKNVRCLNAGGSLVPAKNMSNAFNLLTVQREGFTTTPIPVLPSLPLPVRRRAVRQQRRLEAA